MASYNGNQLYVIAGTLPLPGLLKDDEAVGWEETGDGITIVEGLDGSFCWNISKAGSVEITLKFVPGSPSEAILDGLYEQMQTTGVAFPFTVQNLSLGRQLTCAEASVQKIPKRAYGAKATPVEYKIIGANFKNTAI